jgi:AraC-like DNA-binding protein
MEHPFKNMDFFFKHFDHLERRFPNGLRLQNVAFLQKNTQVVHTFSTFNFSFILRGSGSYKYQGVDHPIQAPCVLTQWPKGPMVYGPDDTWEELYFIFPASAGEELIRRKMFSFERPFWHIDHIEPVMARLEHLYQETHRDPLQVDFVDLAAEAAIMESLMTISPFQASPEEVAIHLKAKWLHENPFIELPIEKWCRELHMSESSFRRSWQNTIGMAPKRFRAMLILQEARRLLVESNWSIAKISEHCQFEDPLYFSRKFRKEVGLSPREYRQQNCAFAPKRSF